MECAIRRTTTGVLLVFTVATLLTACNGSKSGSPLAPTNSGAGAVVLPPPSVTTGASIAGLVKADATSAALRIRTASTGLSVHLVGSTIDAAVDGSGHFELTNVPEGDAHLQFTGPGVNATATIGAVSGQEHIEIVVTINGTSAAVETTQRSTSPDVTLTDTVTIVSGTCPAVTFAVGSKTVVTTSTTAFSPGTCADVKTGVNVTVVGTTGTDGRVTAKTVSVPKGAPTTTLNGVIAGLTGTCPSLSFTVNGTAVVTNAATSYGGGGTCADVKNGDTRYAAATQQSDGQWLVTYLSGAIAK